ncbi:MAG: class II aldolase/adducin family protein [Bacteroidetes bacterium]|nr:class II aldolase/adducin family protein [Bacteroidota bacterium]
MSSRFEIIKNIVEVCHKLEAKGFVAATDGNVSARLPNGNILTTPASLNKGFVRAEDLVEVTVEGKLVSKQGKPSSEIGMHLFIYRERKDVNAVVHAHPVYATAFAAARKEISVKAFPEVLVAIGRIPLAEYATPSTGEVADSLQPFVQHHEAVLLMNHGAVTYGGNVWEAYFRMEKVEHAAHIQITAQALEGIQELSPEQIKKLSDISYSSYGKVISQSIINSK